MCEKIFAVIFDRQFRFAEENPISQPIAARVEQPPHPTCTPKLYHLD